MALTREEAKRQRRELMQQIAREHRRKDREKLAELRSRIRNVKGEETLRIDPGTVAGVSAPATYVFGNLQTLEFEIRPVPL